MPNNQQDETYRFSTTGYSESSIYGKSTDTKGHYAHRRVNFPPNLINAIAYGFKDWGYPTIESFIRDATVHRLHWWMKHGSENNSESWTELSVTLAEEAVRKEQAAYESVDFFRNLLASAKADSTRYAILAQLQNYYISLPDGMKEVRERVEGLLAAYQ